MAFIVPEGKIRESATAITQIRIENTLFENIFWGFICGLFMYIAVSMYETKPIVTSMCVAAFILVGANHCVADMFYLFAGQVSGQGIFALVATTIGNLAGCNILSFCEKISNPSKNIPSKFV